MAVKNPPVEANTPEIKTLTPEEKRRKIIFLLTALIGINIFFWGTIYYIVSGGQSPVSKIVNTSSNKEKLSPTPFPYQEMTIPALRARDYKSSQPEE